MKYCHMWFGGSELFSCSPDTFQQIMNIVLSPLPTYPTLRCTRISPIVRVLSLSDLPSVESCSVSRESIAWSVPFTSHQLAGLRVVPPFDTAWELHDNILKCDRILRCRYEFEGPKSLEVQFVRGVVVMWADSVLYSSGVLMNMYCVWRDWIDRLRVL